MRRLLLLAAFLAPALSTGAASNSAWAQSGPAPLRTAVDGTFAPHAFPKLDGGVQGFNVDLFTEVAKRLGRPITIDSASFSGLVPALNAGRYDFLAAPVTVTQERAENLLFTEGYLFTEFQFGIRKGSRYLVRVSKDGEALARDRRPNRRTQAATSQETTHQLQGRDPEGAHHG